MREHASDNPTTTAGRGTHPGVRGRFASWVGEQNAEALGVVTNPTRAGERESLVDSMLGRLQPEWIRPTSG